MDKLKFTLFSIVVLSLLGLLGYWAVFTIQSGTEYQTGQKLKQLKKENEDLQKEVARLTEKINVFQSQSGENILGAGQEQKPQTEIPAQTTTYKYQSLINELQKLVDGNVLMKLKSSGSRVGTVQQFLNIYNNTSNRIDNDYGANMEKAIATFQKDQGLTGDGQAGKETFIKMISWLKKQG